MVAMLQAEQRCGVVCRARRARAIVRGRVGIDDRTARRMDYRRAGVHGYGALQEQEAEECKDGDCAA